MGWKRVEAHSSSATPAIRSFAKLFRRGTAARNVRPATRARARRCILGLARTLSLLLSVAASSITLTSPSVTRLCSSVLRSLRPLGSVLRYPARTRPSTPTRQAGIRRVTDRALQLPLLCAIKMLPCPATPLLLFSLLCAIVAVAHHGSHSLDHRASRAASRSCTHATVFALAPA